MTEPGFLSDIVEFVLGWFQYLVNSLVALLTGASGGSFARWLSEHWLRLLLFFLLAGCVTNLVVYLIRWRPHWWWFAKKRLIVPDAAVKEPVRPARKPSTIVPRRKQEDDLFALSKPAAHPVKRETVVPKRAPSLFGDEEEDLMSVHRKK